jgi:putative FmdB family regulatory protein
MPAYVFKCPKCGLVWEKRMSIQTYEDTKDSIVCPVCGYDEQKRQYDTLNFILKGRGWFRDNYKSLKDEKKEAEAIAKSADPTYTEE